MQNEFSYDVIIELTREKGYSKGISFLAVLKDLYLIKFSLEHYFFK